MGTGVFLFFSLPPILQLIETRGWATVPCKIVSSSLGSSHTRRGLFYKIDVVYTYGYNGQSYRSDRYRFRQLNLAGGKAEKEQDVRRLSPGSTANCFVNPAHPDQAVMNRDFNPDLFAEYIPLTMAALGIAGSIKSAQLRRRLKTTGFENTITVTRTRIRVGKVT